MAAERNLADLFAQLWHELAGDLSRFEEILEQHTHERSRVLYWAGLLDEEIAAAGAYALTLLSERLARSDEFRTDTAVLIAQAIDRWYGRLSSEISTPAIRDVLLARANRTLLKTGRFNTDSGLGYVLPKRPRWGRWSDPDLELPNGAHSVWETFKSLIVAPAEIAASDPDDPSHARTVRFSYRLVDPTILRAVEPDWQPVIGFAPLAEAPDDLDIRLVKEDGKHWYDAQVRDLGSRAATTVQVLCEAGAHIIVFPELVMHPEALQAIRRAIATHGPRSQLRLVLAGTSRQPSGGSRPLNEARLFNHRGTEIARQCKLHRWNLPHDLRKRYGLDDTSLDGTAALFEFMTPGEEILVVEQSQFGRLAVMVCEDLGRSEPGHWLREHMLLDWLLTPILDSSMNPDRWMAQCGSKAALGGRCRVIVANSFSLTHRQNVQNRKTGKPTLNECGVGLCIDLAHGIARYSLRYLAMESPSGGSCTVRWDPERWAECPKRPLPI
jgi:hypothetical protein